jgi:pilus assembly protein Flp/PilA
MFCWLLPVEGKGLSLTFSKGRSMLKSFLKDETGLELSEYAVAAALVALAAVVAFQALGTNIGTKINELAGKLQ